MVLGAPLAPHQACFYGWFVTKLEFLCGFYKAFFASITKGNIQGGFAGAGLMPYDLERVISKLDVRLRTPTPLNSQAGTLQP